MAHLWPQAIIKRCAMTCSLLSMMLLGAFALGVSAPVAQASGRGPTMSYTRSSVIHDVLIEEHDYYYTMPRYVPTGHVEFMVENHGRMDHMAQIIGIKPGHTKAQVLTDLRGLFSPAAQQKPSLEKYWYNRLLSIAWGNGGTNSIFPGGRQDVIENVQAGHYIVVCFDSNAAGVPHFELGMVKDFWATSWARSVHDWDDPTWNNVVRSAGTIYEDDFAIHLPRTIQYPGAHIFRIVVSQQMHELAIQRVPAGTTRAQYLQCLRGPQSACKLKGQPIDYGGAAALAPGHVHYIELNLPAGTYAVLCFVPDKYTGMPHALMGMVNVFTVKGTTHKATYVPPTKKPTTKPTPKCIPGAVNCNPWGYNFVAGTLIYSPPSTFCNYFKCIANFWNGRGYVEECRDLTYSKSGGISGACSDHGGDLRPLYKH